MKFASLALLILTAATSTRAHADVTAERSDHGAIVKIDGQLFTEYYTKAGQSPALWPIISPTGKAVTRSFPFTQADPQETEDHPHHQSLWLTHDQVSGADFWMANKNEGKGADGPHIKHREFVAVKSAGATAQIVTRNDWMNGNRRICEDERTIIFGTRPGDDRWMDFQITIKATDSDVTFGDTKEGTFALRVADSMRVDAKQGGKITNSEGQTNADAWGLPARWVDYTGPVDGEIVGIAMFSHPKSFRPVPRWHVRTYGLFTANPFGQRDFPKPELADQGAVALKKGESLTLRYRVLVHAGETDRSALEQAFQEFAAK
jgi:hypothetical protein